MIDEESYKEHGSQFKVRWDGEYVEERQTETGRWSEAVVKFKRVTGDEDNCGKTMEKGSKTDILKKSTRYKVRKNKQGQKQDYKR